MAQKSKIFLVICLIYCFHVDPMTWCQRFWIYFSGVVVSESDFGKWHPTGSKTSPTKPTKKINRILDNSPPNQPPPTKKHPNKGTYKEAVRNLQLQTLQALERCSKHLPNRHASCFWWVKQGAIKPRDGRDGHKCWYLEEKINYITNLGYCYNLT